MLKVKIPFVGNGYNMPDVGELIDPPADVAKYLVQIGVAVPSPVDPLNPKLLSEVVIPAWQGESRNGNLLQKAFYHRAWLNGMACMGEYRTEME